MFCILLCMLTIKDFWESLFWRFGCGIYIFFCLHLLQAPGVSLHLPLFLCLWLFGWESWDNYIVTVSHSYRSPLPPFLSRKETGATSVCVYDTVPALCVCVCLSGRMSGLIHIILNRIFPSRVLLPPSFRSLPKDSRFSRKSAAAPRAHCLFWSIIVPEVQKQWVSTAVTPPTCHEMLNY